MSQVTPMVQPLLLQFQQLFFLSKVVGVLPQDLTKFRHKNVLEKSRNGMIYMLGMLALYVVLYNLLIYSFSEDDRTLKATQSEYYRGRSLCSTWIFNYSTTVDFLLLMYPSFASGTLTFVIGLFLTYIGLIMMATDQVTALFNQGRLGELYERIRVVDERLYREQCQLDNSCIAKRIRIMLVMTIIFELFILLTTYIELVDYTQWLSLLWMVSAIPTFINTLDKIWFAVSLYALKERFEAINATLEDLVTEHEKFQTWLTADNDAAKLHTADSSETQPPQYDSNLEYLYKELGGIDIGSMRGSDSKKNKVAPSK